MVARCQTPEKESAKATIRAPQMGFTIEQRGGQSNVETMLLNGQTEIFVRIQHAGCGGAIQQQGGCFQWLLTNIVDITKPILVMVIER